MVEINRYSEHSDITLSGLSKGILAKIAGRRKERERSRESEWRMESRGVTMEESSVMWPPTAA